MMECLGGCGDLESAHELREDRGSSGEAGKCREVGVLRRSAEEHRQIKEASVSSAKLSVVELVGGRERPDVPGGEGSSGELQ